MWAPQRWSARVPPADRYSARRKRTRASRHQRGQRVSGRLGSIAFRVAGDTTVQPYAPPSGSSRAAGPKPMSCSHRSTAGSPKALTRPTCRKPRRCWRRSPDLTATTPGQTPTPWQGRECYISPSSAHADARFAAAMCWRSCVNRSRRVSYTYNLVGILDLKLLAIFAARVMTSQDFSVP